MKDLTLNRDFSNHEHHNLSRLISVPKEQKIIDMRFKNDMPQGNRKQRKLARKKYREEHYFGHVCECCGKVIGRSPWDHDLPGGLCKSCEKHLLNQRINKLIFKKDNE